VTDKNAAPAVTVIPHLDDVAGSHGASAAMIELAASGAVTSGSVIVPSPWFPDIAAHPQTPSLDLGVHLTLTSESAAFRWRPVSTSDPASGLLDPHGYMWATVPELRSHASPDAVEREMRAQVDIALAAGIDVTHLDHHMGAALAPEFVDSTIRIATDHAIPFLFPADIGGYLDALTMGRLDVRRLAEAREVALVRGLAFGDRFAMPLIHHQRSDYRATLERMLSDLEPGVTYLSLHCSVRGEISAIHPHNAAWRIGEYEAFSDPGFADWLTARNYRIVGIRGFRDRLRSG